MNEYTRREDIGTATLNSHGIPAWLFLYTLPPTDSMQVGENGKLEFS